MNYVKVTAVDKRIQHVRLISLLKKNKEQHYKLNNWQEIKNITVFQNHMKYLNITILVNCVMCFVSITIYYYCIAAYAQTRMYISTRFK